MSKLPSFQFYPGDWMKDPALRSVSYAARGLWMDMLSLMFENDRRGYLQVNGKAVIADQLARMTGGSTSDVSHCLQELENSGVYSRTDDGTIFSRRLVRDEKQRNQTKVRVRRFRNGEVTRHETLTSEVEEEIVVEVDVGSKKTKEVLVSLELSSLNELVYDSYPRKVGRAKGIESIRKAVRKIARQFDLADNESVEYLHKAVIEFARSPAGQKGEYTPHCATWMNQERWNDDRKEWYRESGAATKQQGNSRAAAAAFQRVTGMDHFEADEVGEELPNSPNGRGELSRVRGNAERYQSSDVIEGVPGGSKTVS